MIIIGEKINGSIPSVAEDNREKRRRVYQSESKNFRRIVELHILTVVLLFRRQRKWKP